MRPFVLLELLLGVAIVGRAGMPVVGAAGIVLGIGTVGVAAVAAGTGIEVGLVAMVVVVVGAACGVGLVE